MSISMEKISFFFLPDQKVSTNIIDYYAFMEGNTSFYNRAPGKIKI